MFVLLTQDIIFPDWAWHIVGPLYLMLDGVLSIAWNKGNINPASKSNPKNEKVFHAINYVQTYFKLIKKKWRNTGYYAPRPAKGRAPPKAVNGRGRAGGIVFF